MNQKIAINFEIEKNGRTYVFSLQDGSPVADAFEAAKELMINFSNLAEQKKQEEEAKALETEVVEEKV